MGECPRRKVDTCPSSIAGLFAYIPFFRAFSENIKCLSSVFFGRSTLTMRRGIAQLGSFSMPSSTAESGVSNEMNPTRGRTPCSQRIQLRSKSDIKERQLYYKRQQQRRVRCLGNRVRFRVKFKFKYRQLLVMV